MKHYLRIVINFKNLEQVQIEFNHPAFTIVQNGTLIVYDYDEGKIVNQYDLSDIKDVSTYNYD